MIKFYFLTFGLAIGIFLFACNPDSKAQKTAPSPKGYNFSKPDLKISLNETLDEISGIAFYPDEKKLGAIDDEEGYFFTIDLETQKADEGIKFGKSGDYEDLCNANGTWYILKSNGFIYQLKDSIEHRMSNIEYSFPFSDGYEFESIYFDKKANQLILICKVCQSDEGKGAASAFSFNLATKQFSSTPIFQVDATQFLTIADSKKKEKKKGLFQPSAAEIHPITGELYVLAHQQKILVIADQKGVVKSVYKLDPKLFKQPEGIAFKSNGDLYISNEAKGHFANIYKFTYIP